MITKRFIIFGQDVFKQLTGISVVGSTILGTCLAERYCRIHILTELTRVSVNSDPGATRRNRITRSSEPSFFTCETHTLSWISLKVSTENEPRREKTGFVHMRKQRRRSASR